MQDSFPSNLSRCVPAGMLVLPSLEMSLKHRYNHVQSRIFRVKSTLFHWVVNLHDSTGGRCMVAGASGSRWGQRVCLAPLQEDRECEPINNSGVSGIVSSLAAEELSCAAVDHSHGHGSSLEGVRGAAAEQGLGPDPFRCCPESLGVPGASSNICS